MAKKSLWDAIAERLEERAIEAVESGAVEEFVRLVQENGALREENERLRAQLKIVPTTARRLTDGREHQDEDKAHTTASAAQ